jgi:hypothetical protein
MMQRVVLPEDIDGITDAINSVARLGLRNANSSRYNKLMEKPRMLSGDDEDTMIRELFENWIEVLFQSFTPGCNHVGSLL